MFTNNIAPICLFTYNRLEETKQTIEALQANFLAKESVLYIFSDGWKNENTKSAILAVREYLDTITGFKEIHIIKSEINKGLANSIITGVSQVLSKYDNVIVLEDDLITSPNFLDYMNQALYKYQDNSLIFSISGYTMNLPSLNSLDKDYYLGVRASSWGWGTWKRSWIDIDWDVKDYELFLKDNIAKKYFALGGSDMLGMLKSQMNGKIDSWAVRWCYNQAKRKQYTLFPNVSKIQSIGFSESATHTKNGQRFITILDNGDKTNFDLPNQPTLDNKLLKEFRNKFSLINRLKNKFNF